MTNIALLITSTRKFMQSGWQLLCKICYSLYCQESAIGTRRKVCNSADFLPPRISWNVVKVFLHHQKLLFRQTDYLKLTGLLYVTKSSRLLSEAGCTRQQRQTARSEREKNMFPVNQYSTLISADMNTVHTLWNRLKYIAVKLLPFSTRMMSKSICRPISNMRRCSNNLN